MTPEALLTGMEATWPAAERLPCGPFVLRRGLGGGKRVSAASLTGLWQGSGLNQAEAAMRGMGQVPLFQIAPQDAALDAVLAARGYAKIDPVVGYVAPVDLLADPVPPPLTGFAHWPPLQVARDIWAEGHIGPARVAVMDRVAGPKAAVLARSRDRSAGVGFVAVAGQVAFLHALEIMPSARRQGAARGLMRVAAGWARDQGARDFALIVTEANGPARALYESLGMECVAGYHYREKEGGT